jgi:hypothetical protein
MRMLCVLALAVAVAGCGGQGSAPHDSLPSEPDNAVPKEASHGKQFIWGQATIVLGMTKEDVVRQIERSWKRPQEDPFAGMSVPGIERALNPATAGDTWVLSYGPHTGHAPGGGTLVLTFRNGKLVRIGGAPTVAG